MAEDKVVIELLMDNKNVKVALAQSKKDIQAFGSSVNKIKGLNLDEAFVDTNTVKKVKKTYKDITKVMNTELRKQLSLVKGNTKAENDIIQQFAIKRVNIEKKANDKIQAIRKSGATGGGLLGGLKDITSQAGLGGVSNAIGGMTSGLVAAGVAMAGIVQGARALYGWMSKNLEATQQMEQQSRLIETLFLSGGAARARELSNALEEDARQIAIYGFEVDNVQSSIYKGISAGVFTAETSGDIVDRVARASIGLGSNIDSVISAVGGLSNALGEDLNSNVNLVDENLNLLNGIMDKGVIPNAEILASQVAKTAPVFNALSESSDQAKQGLGGFITTITGAGVKMEEANTLTKAFLNELANPERLSDLQKLGIDGIDFVNRKITDYGELIQSMSGNRQAIADIFGSQEAVLAMNILTDNGSDKFQEMFNAMEATNLEGLFEQKYELMAQTQIQQTNAMNARWEDLGLQAGKALQPLYDTALSVADWFLGAFETVDTAYMLTMQEIGSNTAIVDNINNQYESIKSISDDITGILSFDTMTDVQIAGQFENVKNNLSSIYEISPVIAGDIERILDNPAIQTVEGLDAINIQLERASQLAKYDMLNALNDNVEALKKLMSESSGIGEAITDAFDIEISADYAGGYEEAILVSVGAFSEDLNKIIDKDLVQNIEQQLARLSTQQIGFGFAEIRSEQLDKVLTPLLNDIETKISLYEQKGVDVPVEFLNAQDQIKQQLQQVQLTAGQEAIKLSEFLGLSLSILEDTAELQDGINVNLDTYLASVKDKLGGEDIDQTVWERAKQDATNYFNESMANLIVEENHQGYINQLLGTRNNVLYATSQEMKNALIAQLQTEYNYEYAGLDLLKEKIRLQIESLKTTLLQAIAMRGEWSTVANITKEIQNQLAIMDAMAKIEAPKIVTNDNTVSTTIPETGGTGGSGGGAAETNQNTYQQWLKRLLDSQEQAQRDMEQSDMNSWERRRSQAENYQKDTIDDLRKDLNEGKLLQGEYNRLVEELQTNHYLTLEKIQSEYNKSVLKEIELLNDQTVDIMQDISRATQEAMLFDATEFEKLDLGVAFDLEDESERFAEQLENIRNEYGENAELIEAVAQRHEAAVLQIENQASLQRQALRRKEQAAISKLMGEYETEINILQTEIDRVNQEYQAGENEIKLLELGLGFNVQDEMARYSSDLEKINEMQFTNEVDRQKLIELATEKHNQLMIQQEQSYQHERNQVIEEATNDIEDFLIEQGRNRNTERKSEFELEIDETNRLYQEKLELAKKYNIDISRINQDYLQEIASMYDKQIGELTSSVISVGESYISEYFNQYTEQINEIRNKAGEINRGISQVIQTADISQDNFDNLRIQTERNLEATLQSVNNFLVGYSGSVNSIDDLNNTVTQKTNIYLGKIKEFIDNNTSVINEAGLNDPFSDLQSKINNFNPATDNIQNIITEFKSLISTVNSFSQVSDPDLDINEYFTTLKNSLIENSDIINQAGLGDVLNNIFENIDLGNIDNVVNSVNELKNSLQGLNLESSVATDQNISDVINNISTETGISSLTQDYRAGVIASIVEATYKQDRENIESLLNDLISTYNVEGVEITPNQEKIKNFFNDFINNIFPAYNLETEKIGNTIADLNNIQSTYYDEINNENQSNNTRANLTRLLNNEFNIETGLLENLIKNQEDLNNATMAYESFNTSNSYSINEINGLISKQAAALEQLNNVYTQMGTNNTILKFYRELSGSLYEYKDLLEKTNYDIVNINNNSVKQFSDIEKLQGLLEEQFTFSRNIPNIGNIEFELDFSTTSIDEAKNIVNEYTLELESIIENQRDILGESIGLTLEETFKDNEYMLSLIHQFGLEGEAAIDESLNRLIEAIRLSQPELEAQVIDTFTFPESAEEIFEKQINDYIKANIQGIKKLEGMLKKDLNPFAAIVDSYENSLEELETLTSETENQLQAIRAALQEQGGSAEQLALLDEKIAKNRELNLELKDQLKQQAALDMINMAVSQTKEWSQNILGVVNGLKQLSKEASSGDLAGSLQGVSNIFSSMGAGLAAVNPMLGAVVSGVGAGIGIVGQFADAFNFDYAVENLKVLREQIELFSSAAQDYIDIMELATNFTIDFGIEQGNTGEEIYNNAVANQKAFNMLNASITGGFSSNQDMIDKMLTNAEEMKILGRSNNEEDKARYEYLKSENEVIETELNNRKKVMDTYLKWKQGLIDGYQEEIDLGYNVTENLNNQLKVIEDIRDTQPEIWANDEMRNELLGQGFDVLLNYAEQTGKVLSQDMFDQLSEAEQFAIETAQIYGKAATEKLKLEASNIPSGNKKVLTEFELETKYNEIDLKAVNDELTKLSNIEVKDEFTKARINELLIERNRLTNEGIEIKKKEIDQWYKEQKNILDFQEAQGEYAGKIDEYYKHEAELIDRQIRKRIAAGIVGKDNWELQKKYLDTMNKALSIQNSSELNSLNHRKAMGEFDNNEDEYLVSKLDILNELLEAREAEGIIGAENWKIEEAIYEIEQDRNELIEDRLQLQDQELNNLVKQHQQMLMSYRDAGGVLSYKDKQDLKNVESMISNRLEILGVSPEEISKIMQSFEQQRDKYSEGGWVVRDGGLVHEKEFVIPADSAKKIKTNSPGVLENIKNTGNISLPSDISSMLDISNTLISSLKGMQTGNNINIGGITTGEIIVNSQDSDPELIAKKIINLQTQEIKSQIELFFKNGRYIAGKMR